MKLSGHSYNNDIFDSLLNGISKDVVLLKKEAQKSPQQVKLAFSQTTEENYDIVVDDEMKFIANELLYAAKKANVEISGDDLKQFSNESKSQGLKGKNLERAAKKYCSKVSRPMAEPNGVTRTASAEDLIQFARTNTVMPAGFPEENMGNSKTGGYMGMSKNPNTIWDSEALHSLASKPTDRNDQFGDEQIKASKQAQKDFSDKQKQEFWQDKQDTLSDPNMIHGKVSGVHTQEKSSFNPNLPSNSMSMFSNDRDFSNIPTKTDGENLRTASDERSKTVEGQHVDQSINPSTKSDNSGSFMFQNQNFVRENRTGSQRSATDKLFDGIINSVKK